MEVHSRTAGLISVCLLGQRVKRDCWRPLWFPSILWADGLELLQRYCRGRTQAETAGQKDWTAIRRQTTDTHSFLLSGTSMHTRRHHHVFACVHITCLIRSPFLFSVFPALIPSEETTERAFFLLPHLPPPSPSFFCPSIIFPYFSFPTSSSLFILPPPLFSTSLPPFSLWAATPRGDICWLAAPL